MDSATIEVMFYTNCETNLILSAIGQKRRSMILFSLRSGRKNHVTLTQLRPSEIKIFDQSVGKALSLE